MGSEMCIRDRVRPVSPEFYRLRVDDKVINFSVDSTETVLVKAPYTDFATAYTVEGSPNSSKIKDLTLKQMKLQDNVNALLSFVYTLLTNMVTSALETVGLDPYVGCLHTERPGRVSLALDLVEELRPVLADRFVVSLINKRMVTGKGFKAKENGAVLMDDETRKILLTEWQNKKKETLMHPFLNEKVEWGIVPYVQAMLLARYLRGDLDGYPPFFWK